MMQHRHYPLLPGCNLGEDIKSKEGDTGVEKKSFGTPHAAMCYCERKTYPRPGRCHPIKIAPTEPALSEQSMNELGTKRGGGEKNDM